MSKRERVNWTKRERIEDLEHRMREAEFQYDGLIQQLERLCLTPNPAQHPNGTWERCNLPAGHDDAHRAHGKRWILESSEMASEVRRLETQVEDLEKRARRSVEGLRSRISEAEQSIGRANLRLSNMEATTASAVRVGELEERVESLAESYNGHEHTCVCGHPRDDHEPATEDKQYTCKWDACICRATHD